MCCDRVKRPLRSRLAAAVKVPAGHHLMTLLGQPAKSPQQEPRCDPRGAGVGTLSTEPQGAVRARLRRSRRDGSSRDRGPHSPPQLGRASPRRPRDRRRVGQDLRRGPSGAAVDESKLAADFPDFDGPRSTTMLGSCARAARTMAASSSSSLSRSRYGVGPPAATASGSVPRSYADSSSSRGIRFGAAVTSSSSMSRRYWPAAAACSRTVSHSTEAAPTIRTTHDASQSVSMSAARRGFPAR